MIAFFGLFAARTAPFSRVRFTGFMAALVAVSACSLLADRQAAQPRPAPAAPPAGTPIGGFPTGEAAVVRFAMPAEDVFDDLHQAGLPWFLRRLGATGAAEDRNGRTVSVTVAFEGRPVGVYLERLVALDADRSKLSVSFETTEAALVERFVAPLKLKLDPATVMRVVMAEHLRSNLTGTSFDMHVLTDTPGSAASVRGRAFRDYGTCQDPQTDDFADCQTVRAAAATREAYRDEALHAAPRW